MVCDTSRILSIMASMFMCLVTGWLPAYIRENQDNPPSRTVITIKTIKVYGEHKISNVILWNQLPAAV